MSTIGKQVISQALRENYGNGKRVVEYIHWVADGLLKQERRAAMKSKNELIPDIT